MKRPDETKDREVTLRRAKASPLILATMLIAPGSLILYGLFLFMGSFTVIDFGLDTAQSLAADAALSLIFFIQHSFMVRKPVRLKLSGIIPDSFYNAFYALASGIALLGAMLLWQRTPVSVMAADGAFCWLFRGLFFLSVAGFIWGVKSLPYFDVFGVQKIRHALKGRKEETQPLSIAGAYRWVRHPLYFFSLVMIWSCPDLTADRLLFNLLWTVWILAATLLEERDLVSEFGDRYRTYQAKVPMIIPHRLPESMD